MAGRPTRTRPMRLSLHVFKRVVPRVRRNPFDGYRPERHYMRGPGPMTLSKLGEMLRAETEEATREPLPGRWLELINALRERERPGEQTHRAKGDTTV